MNKNVCFRFSFQQGDNNRMLKGVMRVGHLAKGLLLRGDTNVELVVLCADKPTLTLLKKVVELLPPAIKQVAPENTYNVTINAAEAGLTVTGDGLTVLVQFTSPIMREQGNECESGIGMNALYSTLVQGLSWINNILTSITSILYIGPVMKQNLFFIIL